MSLCASVYMCFLVTCCGRSDFLALVCGVKLWVCHFPIGTLEQVYCLNVLIPDLCNLTYFYDAAAFSVCSVPIFIFCLII